MIRTRSEDLFVELTPGAMMHQALAFSRAAELPPVATARALSSSQGSWVTSHTQSDRAQYDAVPPAGGGLRLADTVVHDAGGIGTAVSACAACLEQYSPDCGAVSDRLRL